MVKRLIISLARWRKSEKESHRYVNRGERMRLKLHNPYIGKEIAVEENKKYYENELQKTYDNKADFIIFTDAKTGNPITIRPSNWAMIEVEEE